MTFHALGNRHVSLAAVIIHTQLANFQPAAFGIPNDDLLKFWTTDIRRMMSERDDRWKALVPKEVVELYDAPHGHPAA